MKRAFLVTASVLFLAAGIATVYGIEAAKSETTTITGTIIDNMCAGLNKTDLANFIKTHTKECALKPPCAASGYSLYHYGALIPFDDESNKKIEQFLNKKDATLKVSVVIRKAADKYSLLSIKNI
jgi:hypothetical protein